MNSKDRKTIESHKQEILLSLPSFINQLLLLLNSGMVLQEALIEIAVNYEKQIREEKIKLDVFKPEYVDIYEESRRTGKSILYVFNNYCEDSQIKELNRVSKILIDSGRRGTDLCHKLSEEGDKLWEERKRIMLEKIRLSESKMSFPLGLLLIALMIIAAAPAMMQMYI